LEIILPLKYNATSFTASFSEGSLLSVAP